MRKDHRFFCVGEWRAAYSVYDVCGDATKWAHAAFDDVVSSIEMCRSVGRSAAADDVKTVTAVERISTSCLPSWEKPDNKRRHQCGLVEFPFPPRPRAGASWLTLLLTAEKASEKSAYWSRGQPLFAPLLRHKSYFRTAKWLDTGDLL